MIFINKMFADKRLRFYEGANKLLSLLTGIPKFGKDIESYAASQNGRRLYTFLGVIAQLGTLIFEFIRKLIYVYVFMYVPYRLISLICPLIEMNKEGTLIFMFFMLSTVCGSLANNILMSLGDTDYMMIKVMLISPYMNFLGKLIYKLATEFVYFTVILCIFGVSFTNSIMLSIVTFSARPVGEMLAILVYENFKWLYNNRSVYNGCIMALSVIFTYVMPIIWGRISSDWLCVVHPIFVLVMIIIGAGASVFLWWYKDYRKIIREAIHIKREV